MVFFADADDYLSDDFYEKVQPYFESTNEVVFFIPDSIYIDSKKQSDRHIMYENIINNYLIDKSLKNELYMRYKMHPPWLKIIKSEFLKTHDIKFDEVIASTDVMFSAKIGYFMRHFDISRDIVYIVTMNVGSLTVNYTGEVIESRVQAYIDWYTFLENRLSSDKIKILNTQGPHLLSISLYNSLSMFFTTFHTLRKNRIPILPQNSLSFGYILPKIYRRFIAKDTKKKYRKFH